MAHVTLHMAMREVFDHVSVDSIVAAARLADDVSRRLLQASHIDDVPRIGVCT